MILIVLVCVNNILSARLLYVCMCVCVCACICVETLSSQTLVITLSAFALDSRHSCTSSWRDWPQLGSCRSHFSHSKTQYPVERESHFKTQLNSIHFMTGERHPFRGRWVNMLFERLFCPENDLAPHNCVTSDSPICLFTMPLKPVTCTIFEVVQIRPKFTANHKIIANSLCVSYVSYLSSVSMPWVIAHKRKQNNCINCAEQ